MLNFIYHPAFEKETANLKRRFSFLEKALESFKLLCEIQFNPENPQQRIAPAKLHKVTQNDLWSIWKIELSVPNIRPNQSPRVWFSVKGSNVAFLCMASHVDNYSDNQMNQAAVGRINDIF
jgi:hypothetical protein